MHIILKHLFIFIFAIISMIAKRNYLQQQLCQPKINYLLPTFIVYCKTKKAICGMVPLVVDCVVIMAIK